MKEHIAVDHPVCLRWYNKARECCDARPDPESLALEEVDGPMLRYGLQALHNSELFLPSRAADRPSKNALERRYEEFIR